MIDNGDMRLNDAGRMIDKTLNDIPDYYPGIELDVMQIMPNHLHGIIVICGVGIPMYIGMSVRIPGWEIYTKHRSD